ncbi:MAG: carbohydrate porin [Telmatospirillum sp.]|nr:carbohydrate porin [Telmatospirillum sp.]
MATPPTITISVDTDMSQATRGGGAFGFLNGIARNQYMLGDMWGLRPFLSKYGMSFTLQETSEILGNVSGGTRKGFEYDGLTTATLQMDTERALGWHGGTFNASALQIHGRNLSADNLDSLQTASGIEADRATRLWEVWYQQKFLDEDRMDVKIGQQSLDQEFMVSQNALLFVNTMFGWPMLPSADMPGGGPAYPLSAMGLRLRGKISNSVTVLAGVYKGSPSVDSGAADSQMDNANGLNFRLTGKPLAIAEIQYAYPSLGTTLYADQPEPLARSYKLGIWYDGRNFDDRRWDDTGLSQANPATSGNPKQHRGNYAIYAVADQMIWQQANELDRTLNVFARVMGTPLTDRNLVDFSANLGLTLREPFLNRDDDSFGVGIGYVHVSDRVAALDKDTIAFAPGTYRPVRGSETFVEVTYQYALAPWWQLQPDVQYVFNPGAGVADSTNQKVKNETVLGLRTNILF